MGDGRTTSNARGTPEHFGLAALHARMQSFCERVILSRATAHRSALRQACVRELREAVARFPSATLWHGWGKLEERQGNLKQASRH